MWEQLDARLTQRQACQTIVALLEMAARDGVEAVLAQRLEALLLIGGAARREAAARGVRPAQDRAAADHVEIPPARRYDALLPSATTEEVAA